MAAFLMLGWAIMRRLPTKRIYLSPAEGALLLPGLEALVNRFATAKLGSFPFADPLYSLKHPEICGTTFDREMFVKVLFARNAVKFVLPGRQPSLDSLHLAAMAWALRLARRENLLTAGVGSDEMVRLERKLERYRKRARHAAEAELGKQVYRQLAVRWQLLLHWAHYNIVRFRPRREPFPASGLYRQQRESTRRLVLDLVTEKADRKLVCHLADLARREVRRGRHGVTLRKLLGDRQRAVGFFADFLLDRIDPELLKPEFQPECVRDSIRAEKFKALTQPR